METYTKISENTESIKQYAPILLPFDFPEEYEHQEYFTIRDIFICAAKFFEIPHFEKDIHRKTRGKGKRDRKYPKKDEEAVRKYIDRQLEGKPCQRTSDSTRSTKMYSRKVVEDFFNDYDRQIHFLAICIAQDEEDTKLEEEKFKEAKDKVPKGSASAKSAEAKKRLVEAEKRLAEAKKD